MSRKHKFGIGETVLCYHGQLLYEAKCLQAVTKDDGSSNRQFENPDLKKLENLEHNTSKQDNQDVETNQPGTSKDQAPCSETLNGLCDEPDPTVEIERQVLTGKLKDINSLPSTSNIGIKEQEQQHNSEIRSEKDIREDGNTSNKYEADKVCDEHHTYVEHTPEEDLNAEEEYYSASSSSTDVPDKVGEEQQYASVHRTQEEEVTEGKNSNSSTTSTTSDAAVMELQELLPFVKFKIQLPEELKHCLVEDWDLVCRHNKLVTLPAKCNITDIFSSYLDYKCDTFPTVNWRGCAALEMLMGLETYFVKILNTQLLYKIERPQYNDISSSHFENVPVQHIYGGIHLLRLFVRLGPLLSYWRGMTHEDVVRRLSFYFNDLLQYLVIKKSEYFGIEHYENASAEYRRRVQ